MKNTHNPSIYADQAAFGFRLGSGTFKSEQTRIDYNQDYLGRLEKIILQRLYAVGVDFIRNGAEPYSQGNLSLSFKGFEGEMLLHRLDLMGIMVSTGSACDSENAQISHVLKAIEADEKYSLGTIRISFGRDNTDDEAIKIAEALISILKNN